MIYENIREARFLSRPNRFVANIEIHGRTEVCHVKNTGRCRELLLPGAEIYVQEWNSSHRKTKFDLIAVRKGKRLINVDSQAPNKVFSEWVQDGGFLSGVTAVKPEVRVGSSRLDFCIEAEGRKIFAEIKGVTLEQNGVVLFPDAPTQRGVKHLEELMECVRQGYEAYAVFIIQMEQVKYFTPNRGMHAAFADTLREASAFGVKVLALDCRVEPNLLAVGNSVEVRL